MEAALTYATVDKTALAKVSGVVVDAVSNKLGTEFDVTATYKIYDNLSYMVGAGYLWTGDYFKGANSQCEDRQRLPADEQADPELSKPAWFQRHNLSTEPRGAPSPGAFFDLPSCPPLDRPLASHVRNPGIG